MMIMFIKSKLSLSYTQKKIIFYCRNEWNRRKNRNIVGEPETIFLLLISSSKIYRSVNEWRNSLISLSKFEYMYHSFWI